MPSKPKLVLRLWGRCVLESASLAKPLHLSSAEALILAVAALEAGFARSRLANMLWPDARGALGNLRVRIHRLNHRAGCQVLAPGPNIGLSQRVINTVPVCSEVLSIIEREGVNACALLAEHAVDGEEAALWLEDARRRWSDRLIGVLSEDLAKTTDDDPQRTRLLEALVNLSPYRESYHRDLMRCHVARGSRASALMAYERCKKLLLDDLGVHPDAATQSLHAEILRTASTPAGRIPRKKTINWPLLERDDVLNALRGVVDQGKHLLIEGEAGVGKTTVLEHLSDAASMLYVRAQPSDNTCAYATLSSLLQVSVASDMALISPDDELELGRLRPRASGYSETANSLFSETRLRLALMNWMHSVAECGVKSIVIDDLHYADEWSLQAIAWLLDGCEAAQSAGRTVTFIFSCRTDTDLAGLSRSIQHQMSHGCLVSHELCRLSPEAIRTLATIANASRLPDEAQIHAVISISQGNPLRARKLLEFGPLSHPNTIASLRGGLSELVKTQLKGCDPIARLVASVMALVGRNTEIDFVAEVVEQPSTTVAFAWSELQRQGLIDEVGFCHDLVRDAAELAIPSTLKTWLHRRIAECSESRGLPAEACMRHWMASGSPENAFRHALSHGRWLKSVGQQEAALLMLIPVICGTESFLTESIWTIAEFLPTGRVNRVITSSGMRGLHFLHDVLISRQKLISKPLAQSFFFYIRALQSSEIVGDVEAAIAHCNHALTLASESPYAQAELVYTLAMYSEYLQQENAISYADELLRIIPFVTDATQHARCRQYEERIRHLDHSLIGTLKFLRAAVVKNLVGPQGHLHRHFELGKTFFALSAWKSCVKMMGKVITEVDQRDTHVRSELSPYTYYVPAALQLGWFDIAKNGIDKFDQEAPTRSLLWQAWMQLMLGDTSACKERLQLMQLKKRKSHSILLQVAQSVLLHELSAATGETPSSHIRETLDLLDELRDGSTGRWPLRWEHMLAILHFCYYREPPFDNREMDRLIERMRRRNSHGHLAQIQLLMAEHAQALGCHEESALRATEASCLLLKGRSPLMVYRPMLAARCATLLNGVNDVLAERMRQKGVGWVLDSADRLQGSERVRFLNAHPAHAELLNHCCVSQSG